jgi:hypothetical protein
VTEEAVLDLVPFRRAGRIVADADGQAGLIGQRLEFAFPQSDPGSVGAAAIGGDHHPVGAGIAATAHLVPPQPDRVDGELGGIMGHPDTDPAGVGGDVVDAVGDRLTQFLVLEVMDVDPPWMSLRAPLRARNLIVADQLLLLGVDGNYRLIGRLEFENACIDMVELGIPVRVATSLISLGITLAAGPLGNAEGGYPR